MIYPQLVLKKGKEKPVLQKHHWIFSGAVAKIPDAPNGALVAVQSFDGRQLGFAYFNRRSSILARMVAFGECDPIESVRGKIREAVQLRKALIPSHTNAYRLINGEGDCLPGLIVDLYDRYLVIQISTLGMELLKDTVVQELMALINPLGVLEKSLLPSRKEEGLAQVTQMLFGTFPELVQVKEYELTFFVDALKGQKTGFFLDQREMRKQVQELAAGKRVLNCFSYTGGFSVYAAKGGAREVASVDCSEEAIRLAEKNISANGFTGLKCSYHTEDVFEYLRRPLPYDLVILDPPAFAKKAKDVIQGCRGYKDINRLAIQNMPSGSLLLTCSCSYHVDEQLFQKVVFQAAMEAKRDVRILSRHRQAVDHPVNLYHPEGDYLKSLLLAIV